MFMKNSFENVWSQKSSRRTSFFPRIHQRLLTLTCFFFLVFSSKKQFCGQIGDCFTKMRPHFKTVFPKKLVCLFYTLNSRMSVNICILCHKVLNGQNIPLFSPSFTNYIFLSNFTDNLGNFSTNLRPHYQHSFFCKYFCFCFVVLYYIQFIPFRVIYSFSEKQKGRSAAGTFLFL